VTLYLIHVDPATFLAIVAASALAGSLAAVAGGRGVLSRWSSSSS
jgi:hypothetical protein